MRISIVVASIIVTLTLTTTSVGARPAQVQPILRPVGLHEAKRLCGNQTPKVECRAQIRRLIAALAWERKQRLHRRAITTSSITPVELGRILAMRRGWTGRQFACLYRLWNRESGWQVSDPNPTSQADGIPQANPASKMASAGADWRTSAGTQITWGLGYIDARYGSPCAALAHSDSQGYY